MQPDDEDDDLLVPASPFRVILGLSLMAGGCLLAALAVNEWIRTIGGSLFLVSGAVMLKTPNKEDK